MLVSFASYNLWLPWQETGLHLARVFTDYEPGIHWPQMQMQSGATGIDTIRIYNPVKQGYDQDPTGAFTRRWLPELCSVPDEFLQEPWNGPDASAIVGTHVSSAHRRSGCEHSSREGSHLRRAQELGVLEASDVIQEKHGSRKKGMPMPGKRRRKARKGTATEAQLAFELDPPRAL